MRNIFSRLTTVILLCFAAAGFISAVPFALLFFQKTNELEYVKAESAASEQTNLIKTELKHDSELFHSYINHLRLESKQKINQKLSDSASKAFLITKEIYKEHAGGGRERIINLIRIPLLHLRFLEGSGYTFAVSGQGKVLFSPVSADIRNPIDPKKLKTAANENHGFMTIGDNKSQEKQIFVKYFEELDIYICSAVMTNDFEKSIMRKTAEFISAIESENGGLFIITNEGTVLTGENTGQNLMEISDPDGRDMLHSHISMAKNGGGFIYYSLQDFKSGKPVRMLSYVLPIEDWNWVIGKTAPVNNAAFSPEASLTAQDTAKTAAAFFIMCSGIILIFLYARRKLNKGVSSLKDTLNGTFEIRKTDRNSASLLPFEFRELYESLRPVMSVLFEESRHNNEQKKFFKTVTDSIPLGVYAKNTKNGYRFSLWNDAMAGMLNIPASSALGKTEDELREEYPNLPVFRSTDRDAEIMKSFVIIKELEIHSSSGQMRTTFTGIPLFNSQGDVETVLGVLENNTSGIRLEKELIAKTAQLEELNRNLEQAVAAETEKRRKNEHLLFEQSKFTAMGQMINSIAHQWRQPINALGLYIQDFEDSFESGEMNLEYVKSMTESCMYLILYLSKTIDDFRNFYAANEARVRFNIVEMVFESLAMATAKAEYANIELTAVINNSKPISVTGNIKTDDCKNKAFESEGFPTEFKQVMLNIYHNAIEAIAENREKGLVPRTGTIETFISLTDDHIVIEVKDNGGGIPEDIMPEIFLPYFTTKEQGKGTGVGLYMCRTVIETNMDGKINARNENSGAAFTIELPR